MNVSSLPALKLSTIALTRATQRNHRIVCMKIPRRSFHPSTQCGGPVKTTSYHNSASDDPLVNWTLGQQIRDMAKSHANKPLYAFMEENLEFTFGEFSEKVDRCAQGLLAIGFEKGDTLLLFCPNRANWLIIFSACATLGVVTASVHPGYTKQELFNAMDKVQPKALFIPEAFKNSEFYVNICKWIPEVPSSSPGNLRSERFPSLKSVILDSPRSLPGTVNVREIMAGGDANVEEYSQNVGSDDPFTVIFTSGTTGAAKAALLIQHAFINNANIANKSMQLARRECILCPLPFFHVFGLMAAVTPFVSGLQVIFPSIGYDQLRILKAIEKYKCTRMMGSPTMYIDLLNNPEFKKHDTSSMQSFIMGGSICTPDMRKSLETITGGVALTGYGSTETSTICTVLKESDPLDKRMTTVGRPIDHIEIKIANPETGLEKPIGETGEVWIRGFNIFNGYIGEEAKTKEVITSSRWYKSGDLGKMDNEGYISIVGRVKDLIIRGGENVHPIDIEVELDNHPAVEESQVIAVPDERLGEEICAVIVVKEGCKVTEEELRTHLKDKVAYFKMPKYFLFEFDIPKTAIGKAQKNRLREIATQKLGLK